MSFAARDYKRAYIEDKGSFIRSMLNFYPFLYKRWRTKEEKNADEEANFVSQGDEDVRLSVKQELMSRHDYFEEFANIFYQSILLIAYGYFEESLSRLNDGKEARQKKDESKITALLKAICKCCECTISTTAQEAFDFIDNDVRPLRNYICHAEAEAKPEHIAEVRALANKYNGVKIDEKTLLMPSPVFVEKFLNSAGIVLKELCDVCGHKIIKYAN